MNRTTIPTILVAIFFMMGLLLSPVSLADKLAEAYNAGYEVGYKLGYEDGIASGSGVRFDELEFYSQVGDEWMQYKFAEDAMENFLFAPGYPISDLEALQKLNCKSNILKQRLNKLHNQAVNSYKHFPSSSIWFAPSAKGLCY